MIKATIISIIILGLASCGKTDCYKCVWEKNGRVQDESVLCDMSQAEINRLENANTASNYSMKCELKQYGN